MIRKSFRLLQDWMTAETTPMEQNQRFQSTERNSDAGVCVFPRQAFLRRCFSVVLLKICFVWSERRQHPRALLFVHEKNTTKNTFLKVGLVAKVQSTCRVQSAVPTLPQPFLRLFSSHIELSKASLARELGAWKEHARSVCFHCPLWSLRQGCSVTLDQFWKIWKQRRLCVIFGCSVRRFICSLTRSCSPLHEQTSILWFTVFSEEMKWVEKSCAK